MINESEVVPIIGVQMIFKSGLLTSGSGSFGGLTMSHNKGGLYFRSRSVPTDPSSARQLQVRDAVAFLSQAWSQTLTQAQRDAWDQFAEAVTVVNALGDTIQISGVNHYVRANAARIAANAQLSPTVPLTSIPAAPQIDDLPMLNPIVITPSIVTPDISVAFDDGQDWVNDDGNALMIYEGRPRNPGVGYFKGPYRLSGIIQGDATTPPTSPVVIASAWSPGNGNLVKVRAVLSVGETTDQPTGQSAAVFSSGVWV